MKKHEQPIPLRSIIIMPRWLMISGVVLGSAFILAGVALIVYAIGWCEGGAMGGWIGGGIGCLGGGIGGLCGTLCDWSRRMPAPTYLHQLRNDKPSAFYRKVFWPSLLVFVLGLLLAIFVWNHRAIWHGLVQPSGMLLFISGTIELMRRHTNQQARAVFALYADGALEPDDTAAIDDARQKDSKFDADVQAYLDISEQIKSLASDPPKD